MYSERNIILFDRADKDNTDATVNAVLEYCSKNDIKDIFLASTTGYTINRFLKKMDKNDVQQLYVFTQYLDGEHFMQEDVRRKLSMESMVKGVFDIPPKYLNQIIGQKGVDSLRELSHGIKVCVELVYFADENNLLMEGMKFVAVAGRIEGADTAMIFIMQASKVKMIDIIAFSKNE